jgi:ferritin-like metal-binding protein YciE
MARTSQQLLVKFLSDLYSIELQAIAQLVSAPDLAGDPGLAADFRTHHAETEQQAQKIRARLEELGGSPSVIKDAVMQIGGKGFLLFAKMQVETPGRLVAHAYSYEAMEWAGYSILIRLAEQCGDATTAEIGRFVQAQEREMMQRLERGFDAAESASHRETPADELDKHVRRHLAEAHALECQSIQLLKKAAGMVNEPEIGQVYQGHLDETRDQIARVEQRLRSMGSSPSTFQDAVLKLGGLGWGWFFQAQSDSPSKLAAFAYAVEHLEIAGYELLRRTARRAQDTETEELCRHILGQERSMAERLAEKLELSVQATLRAVLV